MLVWGRHWLCENVQIEDKSVGWASLKITTLYKYTIALSALIFTFYLSTKLPNREATYVITTTQSNKQFWTSNVAKLPRQLVEVDVSSQQKKNKKRFYLSIQAIRMPDYNFVCFLSLNCNRRNWKRRRCPDCGDVLLETETNLDCETVRVLRPC